MLLHFLSVIDQYSLLIVLASFFARPVTIQSMETYLLLQTQHYKRYTHLIIYTFTNFLSAPQDLFSSRSSILHFPFSFLIFFFSFFFFFRSCSFLALTTFSKLNTHSLIFHHSPTLHCQCFRVQILISRMQADLARTRLAPCSLCRTRPVWNVFRATRNLGLIFPAAGSMTITGYFLPCLGYCVPRLLRSCSKSWLWKWCLWKCFLCGAGLVGLIWSVLFHFC